MILTNTVFFRTVISLLTFINHLLIHNYINIFFDQNRESIVRNDNLNCYIDYSMYNYLLDLFYLKKTREIATNLDFQLIIW